MKIVFAGTSPFGVPFLKQLIKNKYFISLVITNPKIVVRKKIKKNKIKEISKLNKIKTLTIEKKFKIEDYLVLKKLNPDIIIVASFGIIFPKKILKIPKKYGCINIHPSFLPRWRGSSPIQYTIMMGDKFCGISIIKMDSNIDNGPIIYQEKIKLTDNNLTTKELTKKLSILGSKILIKIIPNLKNIIPKVQGYPITFAPKILKFQAKINWNQYSKSIHNKIRSLNPWPIAFTKFQNYTIRIWRTKIFFSTKKYLKSVPGTVKIKDRRIFVHTKDGLIEIIKIQLPGRKILKSLDLLNSNNCVIKDKIFFL